MIGDCPNFAESAEQNETVPLSQIILIDAFGRRDGLLTKPGNI